MKIRGIKPEFWTDEKVRSSNSDGTTNASAERHTNELRHVTTTEVRA